MIESEKDSFNIGLHAFFKAYENQAFLFLTLLALLAQTQPNAVWRANCFADEFCYRGWIIVGANLNGEQISYLFPDWMREYTWFLDFVYIAPVLSDACDNDAAIKALKRYLGVTDTRSVAQIAAEQRVKTERASRNL